MSGQSETTLTCHACRRIGTNAELANTECSGEVGCVLDRTVADAIRAALLEARAAIENALRVIA